MILTSSHEYLQNAIKQSSIKILHICFSISIFIKFWSSFFTSVFIVKNKTKSMEQSRPWEDDNHSASNKFSCLMEPRGSLPCTQEPSIGPWPEVHGPSPHPQLKMQFNRKCPSVPGFLIMLFNQNYIHISNMFLACCIPCSSFSSLRGPPKNVWCRV